MGIFCIKEKVSMYIIVGVKDVVIFVLVKGKDVQIIVLGVNDDQLDCCVNVFFNVFCIINCLVFVVKILNDNWGINIGLMIIIYVYIVDQCIQDVFYSDLCCVCVVVYNIVFISIGVVDVVNLVYEGIEGKLIVIVVCVLVIMGFMVELNVVVDKFVIVEEVNVKFKVYVEGDMKGIFQYIEDLIVSSDIVCNIYSFIFDVGMIVVNG